jgi:ferredoxin--NADP+ reductase
VIQENFSKDSLRVAVIGSGPSGFYIAEALLKQTEIPVQVDMFDRLPTPYGLARGGVAPDHQKIKGVIAIYEKIACLPGFRFFGNVKLGETFQIADLKERYHQIVYAVGAESDRKMDIPGEDFSGSHSATAFVGWYNGHPDFREEKFDLSVESVAIVGIGNVAMDVSRILAEDPELLAKTDIANYALDALRKSRVKTIYLLGRRGLAQAAYSPAEIREIGGLSFADLVVDPQEAKLDEVSKADYANPENKKNVDYVQERAKLGEGTKSRKIRLRFCVSPTEIISDNGKVVALKIEKNILVSDEHGKAKAKGTGQFETLPVSLVFRSVGYRGIPIPGVSFDSRAGKIPNEAGRVVSSDSKGVCSGEYVVGWAKRGPSGLIGSNRPDSVAVAKNMITDAQSGKFGWKVAYPGLNSIEDFLKATGVRPISFADWKKIDRMELEAGQRKGKIREKFSRIPDMLEAIDSRPAAVSS